MIVHARSPLNGVRQTFGAARAHEVTGSYQGGDIDKSTSNLPAINRRAGSQKSSSSFKVPPDIQQIAIEGSKDPISHVDFVPMHGPKKRVRRLKVREKVKEAATSRDEKSGLVLGRGQLEFCLLYTSPSPRDRTRARMPSSA